MTRMIYEFYEYKANFAKRFANKNFISVSHLLTPISYSCHSHVFVDWDRAGDSAIQSLRMLSTLKSCLNP